MDISYPYLDLESGIEKIYAGGYDCRGDVKPDGLTEGPLDPETGHEEDDDVRGER